jgi:hypothetical protein
MEDEARLINQVTEALDRYYWAFVSRDLDLLKSAFVADESMMAIGTDLRELWLGWKEFERYARALFATLTDVRFERRELRVQVAPEGDVAWFVETSIGHFTTAEQVVEEKLRTSGVFVRAGEDWKLAHFHRSIPVPGTFLDYGPSRKLPERF